MNAKTTFSKRIGDDDDNKSTASTTPTDITTPDSSWDESLSSMITTTMDDSKDDATLLYIDREVVCDELGYGPSRYAIDITKQSSISDQLSVLAMEQKMCFDNLKCKWEESHEPFPYVDWYLRFAKCSPGPEKFNEATAWNVMLYFNRKYCSIADFNIQTIEAQLWTKTLFPVPGLKTLDGNHDMLYFRPSRFYPRESSTEIIVDNLVYVINTMLEKEESCTNGIGIFINMKDWNQKENYSVLKKNYFYSFIKILQGTIPVRIRSIIIFQPPTWFTNKIWLLLLRPILSKELKEKLVMIHDENELGNYLASDYRTYLPDEMESGQANTDDMVRDYIMYRRYIEQIRWTIHHNDIEKAQSQQSPTSTMMTSPPKDNKSSLQFKAKNSGPTTIDTADNNHSSYEESIGRRRSSINRNYEVINGQIRVERLSVTYTGEQLEL